MFMCMRMYMYIGRGAVPVGLGLFLPSLVWRYVRLDGKVPPRLRQATVPDSIVGASITTNVMVPYAAPRH